MTGMSFSAGSSTGPSPRKPATDSDGHGGPNSKKPRLSTGGGACVESQRDKLSSKRAKEIYTTEKVILEAEQTFRMMADIHTIKGVTVKQLEALEKKLADRLTPALISVYSHNYDAALDAAPAPGGPPEHGPAGHDLPRDSQGQPAKFANIVTTYSSCQFP